jgi:hypothetical protein
LFQGVYAHEKSRVLQNRSERAEPQ